MRQKEALRLNPKDSAKALPKEVTKTCEDSRVELVLPFSSDDILRQQYVSPFGHVRLGRILEDLDAFAGNVAFLHCDDGNPSTHLPNIVTASVDKLDLVPKVINSNQDLKIIGGVTSVGSSSMEVRIDAFQGPGWPCVLTTFFTMVAMDPTTGKSHRVNRLLPVSDLDALRAVEGERRKGERLKVKESALHVRVPSPEETELVHRFFMDTAKAGTRTEVEIASTHQRSLIFCSQQQRNIHNKIFGGFLMKQAFELAFSTAYLFAGHRPYFSALGDITFKYPVEIGSLLDLRAAVVYTEKNDVQVHVTARVHDPKERTVKKTNDFAFSFDLYDENMQEIPAPAVRPNTYAEAMSFLEGRRCLHRHRTAH